jgi:NodT family efflux transporter outer membrane factor (OMF) lipoprotein
MVHWMSKWTRRTRETTHAAGPARAGISRLLMLTAAVCTLALIAGCAVGPDYTRPKVAVPAGYKEMEGWKVAQPKDQGLSGKWWETFGDPLLNELQGKVDISNQNVRAAEAQFRQAMAFIQAARSAYFPTVTTSPSFTRSLRSSTLTTSSFAGGIPTSDYLLPVNISWEADVWGRIRRTVEASRANAQASAADLEGVRLSVRAALAQNYFQLRTLDAQRKVIGETVAAYGKSLDLTRNRYASGIASQADVLQAETQLKTTQAQLIDVGVQRSQFEHAIAVLIGTPASLFSIAPAPLGASPPEIPVGVASELLERRPDIAGAERRMAAANAQIGVATSAFFPRVTLSAAGGYESGDSPAWLTWPSHFWSVGPALAQTLFQGGSRQAVTEQARAAYDATVASYRQTVLTGFQEVEDNLAALRILDREAGVQNEAVDAARRSLAVVTNQYRAGTVNYLSVIVAQAAALSNERTAVDIRGRRMAASVLLIKALGGGWDASLLAAPGVPISGKENQ